jgi:hypothetical protein
MTSDHDSGVVRNSGAVPVLLYDVQDKDPAKIAVRCLAILCLMADLTSATAR